MGIKQKLIGFRAGHAFKGNKGDMFCRDVRELGMAREICSSSKLQGICLSSLKECPGFEHVNEILIQPRESFEGGTNWTLAAVRPRVSNNVLRAARGTIDMLQKTYELLASEVATRPARQQAPILR